MSVLAGTEGPHGKSTCCDYIPPLSGRLPEQSGPVIRPLLGGEELSAIGAELIPFQTVLRRDSSRARGTVL